MLILAVAAFLDGVCAAGIIFIIVLLS